MSIVHLTTRPGAAVTPHPVMRATAMSSLIGLVAGLVLGLATQVREHDAG
jgi:hypothetical protein